MKRHRAIRRALHKLANTRIVRVHQLVRRALAEHLAIPGYGTMLPFIMMLGVIMIAAPGAPGGGVMSALGLLTSMLGFGEASIALMIALYLAQDSFGTACNVTGDGVIALWADRFARGEPALITEQDAA